ncbi:MAG: hypothetical protein IJD28_02250 [Deferribacterales bacterium]|nr:hypothetical protein [Deferribacterales bacterium]
MMSYEEFVNAIKTYLTSQASGSRTIFITVLAISVAVFFVWFVIYLRKEYLKKKASTDTFNSDFAKDIDYPGFYPGGAPKKENEKKPPRDPWGEVNDEY